MTRMLLLLLLVFSSRSTFCLLREQDGSSDCINDTKLWSDAMENGWYQLYETYSKDIITTQTNNVDSTVYMERFESECLALGGATIVIEVEYAGECSPTPHSVFEPLCVAPTCLENSLLWNERHFIDNQRQAMMNIAGVSSDLQACTSTIMGITKGIDSSKNGDWNECYNSARDYDFSTLEESYVEYADNIVNGDPNNSTAFMVMEELGRILDDWKALCEGDAVGGVYFEFHTSMYCTTQDGPIIFRDPFCMVPCLKKEMEDDLVMLAGGSYLFRLYPDCSFVTATVLGGSNDNDEDKSMDDDYNSASQHVKSPKMLLVSLLSYVVI
mmetsp:Transcript_17564/g.30618  ORF Transcript_17564/g.30618 Transcript_17564/m.30618 type:complete len:327 (+) Transcript_17564:441-1421(+)